MYFDIQIVAREGEPPGKDSFDATGKEITRSVAVCDDMDKIVSSILGARNQIVVQLFDIGAIKLNDSFEHPGPVNPRKISDNPQA